MVIFILGLGVGEGGWVGFGCSVFCGYLCCLGREGWFGLGRFKYWCYLLFCLGNVFFICVVCGCKKFFFFL